MLKIEIVDDNCEEGTAYNFEVPLNTPWDKLKEMIGLFFPTATSVNIGMEAEE